MNLTFLISIIALGSALATVTYFSLRLFPAKEGADGIITKALKPSGADKYLQYLPISVLDKYSNQIVKGAGDIVTGVATGLFQNSYIIPLGLVAISIILGVAFFT